MRIAKFKVDYGNYSVEMKEGDTVPNIIRGPAVVQSIEYDSYSKEKIIIVRFDSDRTKIFVLANADSYELEPLNKTRAVIK